MRFVQENFELYHETLYLAVKMMDHYLSKTPVHRELLQLVGSTTMLIASKFEVRTDKMQISMPSGFYFEGTWVETCG